MRLFVIASIMLCSTVAFAAPARTDVDADAAARKAKPANAKVTAEYDFENDDVTGDALSPDHQPIRTRATGTHESMIRLRMHFIPQMLQMANDV
jgi:hypothetical protein